MGNVSKALAWSAVERFATQGVSFCLSIILARLIAPESYGLIVMIQVFISLSQVFIEGGFSNALMQKKNRTETDYYTVFLFNLAIAFVLYSVLYLAAPFIAEFYDTPQLKMLTRVISLNLIFSSLSIVQRTRLTIELDFKIQSKASLLSVLTGGGLGIILAYNGYEVWALVAQSLTTTLLGSILLMGFSRWTPKLIFSKGSFIKLFNFGSKLLLGNLITSIYLNIYNLTIGKFYTSENLAYYNRAFYLSQFPSVNINSIIQRIVYPVLCESQDNRVELIDKYYKFLHASNVLVFGLMTILCVLASPLISVLFTDRWLPCAEFLSIYCLNFSIYCWLDQSGCLLLAIGKSGPMLKSNIYKRIISFIILVATISLGIRIICIGVCVSTFIELVINLFYCQKYVGVKVYDQCKRMVLPVLNCLITAIVILLVLWLIDNPFIQLFIGGTLGVIVYVSLIFIMKLDERRVVLNTLKKIMRHM